MQMCLVVKFRWGFIFSCFGDFAQCRSSVTINRHSHSLAPLVLMAGPTLVTFVPGQLCILIPSPFFMTFGARFGAIFAPQLVSSIKFASQQPPFLLSEDLTLMFFLLCISTPLRERLSRVFIL